MVGTARILVADDTPGMVAVSIGNPYVGVLYKLFPKISGEFRYGLDPEIKVLSGRGYYNFSVLENTNFFAGAEYGQINFNSENISGTGSLTMPFIGVEFIVLNRFAVVLDLGYANITLGSRGFSINGAEWMLNAGLNYYFAFRTAEESEIITDSTSTVTIQPSLSTVEASSSSMKSVQPIKQLPANVVLTESDYITSMNAYLDLVSKGASVVKRKERINQILVKYRNCGFDVSEARNELNILDMYLTLESEANQTQNELKPVTSTEPVTLSPQNEIQPAQNEVVISSPVPAGNNYISVQIKDTGGKFVSQAKVSIYQEEQLIAAGITDSFGEYKTKKIPAGKYIVRVQKDDYVIPEQQYVEITSDKPAEVFIVLASQ